MSIRDGWFVTVDGWAEYASEPGCGTPEQAPAPEFSVSTGMADTIDILIGPCEVTDALDFAAEPMVTACGLVMAATNNGEGPDGEEPLELCAAFQVPAVRDRLVADIIDSSDEEIEFQKVLLGRTGMVPVWGRVDTAERMLVRVLRFGPWWNLGIFEGIQDQTHIMDAAEVVSSVPR